MKYNLCKQIKKNKSKSNSVMYKTNRYLSDDVQDRI